ncbi:hypothetical protein [Streptomyces sp. NBC_00209]|uniref:hypothetical protein n=1 Tax=Streptomyces sp. NBC_00209 TaxID=2975682 RepID=UPI00324DB9AF
MATAWDYASLSQQSQGRAFERAPANGLVDREPGVTVEGHPLITASVPSGGRARQQETDVQSAAEAAEIARKGAELADRIGNQFSIDLGD